MGALRVALLVVLAGAQASEGADPPQRRGVTIRKANELVRATARLCIVVGRVECGRSIESPHGLRTWHTSEMWALRESDGADEVWFDQCSYRGSLPGRRALFRKRNRLLSNVLAFRLLHAPYRGGHEHEKLAGAFFDVDKESWKSRTEVAAAYPAGLCQRWATRKIESGMSCVDAFSCGLETWSLSLDHVVCGAELDHVETSCSRASRSPPL